MSNHNAQRNLKKVMRIALIGIKPAHQVVLKGYLRVLLRLDVDLEWISASHADVDLFIINNDFRHADSVIKLLASQSQKPVLYSSRTDIDEGWMTEDRIILPLKKLDALNEWLQRHVMVLNQDVDATKNTPVQEQESPEARRMEVLNRINQSKAALGKSKDSATQSNAYESVNLTSDQIKQPLVPNDSAAPSSVALSAEINTATSNNSGDTAESSTRLPSQAESYQGIIAFIKHIEQRPNGLHQIIANQQSIAIVDPTNRLLWLSQDANVNTAIPLALDWQLQPYNGVPPAIENADDLSQQLWQLAWLHAELLIPLVNDDKVYHLQHWIKPLLTTGALFATEQVTTSLNKKDRQSLLSVMTALENSPRCINQLAQDASISVKSVKKIIASLLFSGSLTSDDYAQIRTEINQDANSNMQSHGTQPHLTLSVDESDLSHVNASASANVSDSNSDSPLRLEDTNHQSAHSLAMSESVSADDHSSINSNAPLRSDSTSEPSASRLSNEQATPAQQAKRGFLSRLRQKLGL